MKAQSDPAMTSTANKTWVSLPSDRRDIAYYNDPSIPKDFEPETIISLFEKTVARNGSEVALQVTKTSTVDPFTLYSTEGKQWTWSEYYQDCRAFAKALVQSRISVCAVVNILGSNSPEWCIAHLGSILAGCIPAGIYVNSSTLVCAYFSKITNTEVLVVDGNAQLKKYIDDNHELPAVKIIIVWGEQIDPVLSEKLEKTRIDQKAKPLQLFSWDEWMLIGSSTSPSIIETTAELNERVKQHISPSSCALVLYTSGTTGPPKAVMLSHDNVVWSCQATNSYLQFTPDDRVVSYLPLSHVAAMMSDIYYMLLGGGCTYFAPREHDPLRHQSYLRPLLLESEPTLFFAVPRVWEKLMDKIDRWAASLTGPAKLLYRWATTVGAESCENAQYDSDKKGKPFLYGVAKALVFKSVKSEMGLSKTRYCCVGAAPCSQDVLRKLASVGVTVYELFGQSETSGPHTMAMKGTWKLGTCGRPFHGTTTVVDTATKELRIKGRHIFMGYLNAPNKSEEAFDKHGYFCSGDMVEFDDCSGAVVVTEHDELSGLPQQIGFLRIVGRLKDLLITSGGENMSAAEIEAGIRAAMPGVIGHCIVIADGRKFVSVILSLAEQDSEEHEHGHGHGPDAASHIPSRDSAPSASMLTGSEAQKKGGVSIEGKKEEGVGEGKTGGDGGKEREGEGDKSGEGLGKTEMGEMGMEKLGKLINKLEEEVEREEGKQGSKERGEEAGKGKGEEREPYLSHHVLEIGKRIGSPTKHYSSAKGDEAWGTYINDGLERYNSFSAASNAQKVQRWMWFPTPPSEEAEELTPTLKPRRSVLVKKYTREIDDMYVQADIEMKKMQGLGPDSKAASKLSDKEGGKGEEGEHKSYPLGPTGPTNVK